MAKVPYSVETLPKISIVWVGRTNVTDRQTTDDRRQTDGRRHIANMNLSSRSLKNYQFITQCKGDIRHAFKTAKIIVFDPMMCKIPDVPLQDEPLCWSFVVHVICGQLELQVLKIGRFSVGWFMLSARLVGAHLDFSTLWVNHNDFCCFKGVI